MQFKGESKAFDRLRFQLIVVRVVGLVLAHLIVERSHDLLALTSWTEEIEIVGISSTLKFSFSDGAAAVICLATIEFGCHELPFSYRIEGDAARLTWI